MKRYSSRSENRIRLFYLAAVGLALPLITSQVQAAAFTAGDLVVVTVGDGTAALGTSATVASLWEFNTSTANQASPLQVINLPTAASGANQPLTLQGSATSEGFLTLSVDGQYLTMAGYAAIPGTATPASSAPSAINRVVGRIDLNGNVDTTTSLGDAYNGSNIRSAVSTDGINLWTSGNGGSGQGSTAAARYTTKGGTTSTQLNSTTTNLRVVNIFNGQLYASSSSGAFLGISTVGTGVPTASGQTLTLLPGMPTSGTHSSYDFWFKDVNTLYVADDGNAASGGGIQKWTLSGGTWTLQYTLLNNGTTATGVRGLAGAVDQNGDAVLYATSGGTTLLTVTDTGASATPTTLATAPANEAFRGVEIIAVPEPATAALTGMGFVLWGLFRRRS